ncbi:MAG: glycosyltransferase family 39 protein [Chloroflexota bacterium]
MSSAARSSSDLAVPFVQAGARTLPRGGGRITAAYTVGIPVILLVAAFALRVFHIDRESFWLDEGYTLFFSQLPLNRLIMIGGAHEHPPLYYLIVHALLAAHRWFMATRYVSAVAGALSVVAIYHLGRTMFNRCAGVVAAILLTISPFHVWWSRDGRAYALAGLFVLLSYLAVFHALERPRRSIWITYAICTALALYTEYTTAFVLLPQILLLLRARNRRLVRPTLLAWLSAAVLFVPWAGIALKDAASVASDYWIPPPSAGTVENTILEFLGSVTPCPNFPCVGQEAVLPVILGHEAAFAIVAAALTGAALLYALVSARLELSIAGLWVALPFVIVLALARRRSLYVDRVFLDATFGLYLLIAGFLTRKASVTSCIAVATAVIIGISSVASLNLVYSQSSNPDFRSLARDLRSAYRPGQAVVYNPAVLHTLVGAYLPANWRPTRQQLLWFHGYLDVPGWQKRFGSLKTRTLGDAHLLPQLRYGRFDTLLRDAQLRHAVAGERQLWLVTQDYAGVTDNRRWLVAHAFNLLLSQIYFGDARLELWDRRPPDQFGAAIVRPGFDNHWVYQGRVAKNHLTAVQQAPARMVRTLALRAGHAYTVNIEYRAFPGSYPTVAFHTYDHSGHVLGRMVDRFGHVLDSFPRTEWYDMPANDVWLDEPFGFVAPPGTVRGVLILGNAAGTTSWRNIGVYEER